MNKSILHKDIYLCEDMAIMPETKASEAGYCQISRLASY